MKDNILRSMDDVSTHLIDWKEEWKDFIVTDECPQCGYVPESSDTVISYSPKKYSYTLSMLSSFSQYTWQEMHECPECGTFFKVDAESI